MILAHLINRRARLTVLAALAGAGLDAAEPKPEDISSAPTFAKEIAPLLFEHCSGCHHAGGSAPFSLVTYSEVKKRAREIVKMVTSRKMPPWQPEWGHGAFAGERRLTAAQIGTFQKWVEAGTPTGDTARAPAAPTWNDGWQLGKPDLIVTMPEPFIVPADGKDIYQNFVIPAPSRERRFVRAVEMQPGNPTVVHHAFVLLDATGDARRRDAAEDGPGFTGMNAGYATAPDGHFLSWQPGKIPSLSDPKMAWTLEPGTDLVLQLHLRPSGKPESVRATVGLYFTDAPAQKFPYVMLLRSTRIDIAAGESDYAIESAYRLPVDVEALRILPHAHYLAKEMKVWAELPSGESVPLLWIKHWDFNWQGDYQYAAPVSLPARTRILMRYTFDNSAANIRNPSHPPQRVRFGLQTSDEMAECWLQVLPRSGAEREILRQDWVANYGIADSIGLGRALLERDPGNIEARVDLANALGAAGRLIEAAAECRRVIEADPKNVAAHFALANVHLAHGRTAEAKATLEEVLRLDSSHFKAENNLGMLLMSEGDWVGAVRCFEASLRINASQPQCRENLRRAREQRAAKPPQ